MHYLCGKYYDPITVQYYIPSCVSLGTWATFVGLDNQLNKWNVVSEWKAFIWRGLSVLDMHVCVCCFGMVSILPSYGSVLIWITTCKTDHSEPVSISLPLIHSFHSKNI